MSSEKLTNLRVAVLWHDAIVVEKVIPKGKPVTIGEGLENTLVLPDAAGIGEKYQLFSPSGDGYTVHLTPAMKGRMRHDAEETTVEAVRKKKGNEVRVDGHDWGVIDLGPIGIFFQFVGESERLPRKPIWLSMETAALGALLTALVLHLGGLIASFLMWEEEPRYEDLTTAERLVQFLAEKPPPEIKEEEQEEKDEDVGKKAGGEEGKFGQEDKKDESKVPKRDGQMVDKIKDIGVHKVLTSNLVGTGPLKNVFSDKSSFDSKLNAAMSGVADGDLVIGHGAGGMGLRGTGEGGGGEGFGRIHGMGRIDTGGGRGTKASLGGKAKAKATARTSVGAGSIAGFCKEADIQRVVNARRSGISYCYEKELARNPELGGKVTLNWRIGLDGKVMKVIVESSTLGNKDVEGCMIRNVERWTFPKPEGGMCQIKYPFVFNPGL